MKLWFVKLNKDKSCPFLVNGLCGVYKNKPLACTTYPFYVDPFAGLCIDKSCPGVGAGWTKVKDLKKEFSLLRKTYGIHFNQIKNEIKKI